MISNSFFANSTDAEKLKSCKLTLDACDEYANAQHKLIKKQEEKINLTLKHLREARKNEALMPWYVYVTGGLLIGFAGGVLLAK